MGVFKRVECGNFLFWLINSSNSKSLYIVIPNFRRIFKWLVQKSIFLQRKITQSLEMIYIAFRVMVKNYACRNEIEALRDEIIKSATSAILNKCTETNSTAIYVKTTNSFLYEKILSGFKYECKNFLLINLIDKDIAVVKNGEIIGRKIEFEYSDKEIARILSYLSVVDGNINKYIDVNLSTIVTYCILNDLPLYFNLIIPCLIGPDVTSFGFLSNTIKYLGYGDQCKFVLNEIAGRDIKNYETVGPFFAKKQNTPNHKIRRNDYNNIIWCLGGDNIKEEAEAMLVINDWLYHNKNYNVTIRFHPNKLLRAKYPTFCLNLKNIKYDYAETDFSETLYKYEVLVCGPSTTFVIGLLNDMHWTPFSVSKDKIFEWDKINFDSTVVTVGVKSLLKNKFKGPDLDQKKLKSSYCKEGGKLLV